MRSDPTVHPPLDLTLILGGVRAGKSARALSLARSAERGGVLFVATAQAFDDEMRTRIAAHRDERPAAWETLETPVNLATDLERRLSAEGDAVGAVAIDCLTLWVSNVLLTLHESQDAEAVLSVRTAELIELCTRHRWVGGAERQTPRRWIVVSNEVGLGIVPPTVLGRRYRDALGRVNQLVAAAAREVTLMVAGLDLTLKSG
jgi:adenosyl cobinamide kinase/adenosyl cobinamide phosphate guanylyltransferase